MFRSPTTWLGGEIHIEVSAFPTILSCNMSLLVYFPKDQFSPRYGDKFFTISVSGFSIRNMDEEMGPDGERGNCGSSVSSPCSVGGHPHVEYHITVRQGNAQWTVNHRYRAFLEMSESLKKECASQNYPIYFPAFPKKSWWTVLHDENYLNDRRIQLEKYLDAILTDLSRKGLVLPYSLATFLQINPIAP